MFNSLNIFLLMPMKDTPKDNLGESSDKPPPKSYRALSSGKPGGIIIIHLPNNNSGNHVNRRKEGKNGKNKSAPSRNRERVRGSGITKDSNKWPSNTLKDKGNEPLDYDSLLKEFIEKRKQEITQNQQHEKANQVIEIKPENKTIITDSDYLTAQSLSSLKKNYQDSEKKEQDEN